MGKIHTLPLSVVAHIAAGEVVERPAFAVKELIENAVDAGATTIRIELQHAGLESITVTDNGEGMDREDIAACFKPHTTSKILTEHDLAAIKTFGFRGEALASIAAVSSLQIQSRTHHAPVGNQIIIQAGKMEAIEQVGMPVGTRIVVQDLFATVPARKKFLKGAPAELRLCLDIVIRQALAHPRISFVLTHNGKTVIDLPSTEQIQRLESVIGATPLRSFLPLSHEDSYIRMSGFIGLPEKSTATSSKQFLFVNNRPIEDKMIARVIKETYGSRLEKNRHPQFVLCITVAPEAVDVNIHPRKQEVSFADTKALHQIITQAVSQTLASHIPSAGLQLPPAATETFLGTLLKESVIPWDMRTSASADHILQIQNLYIVVFYAHGITFIDQHAAHERILYEQFSAAFTSNTQLYESQVLKHAIALDVSVQDSHILQQHADFFKKIGFGIERFRDNTFIIREVPALFQDRDHRALIGELLEDISAEHTQKIDEFSETVLKYLACRAAVKAGDPLTVEECRTLIEKLEKTPNNTTCPHGRPTRVELSFSSLHKQFKRL